MDTEQLQRTLARYKGLVEVSALIASISDFNELLSAILDVARRVMDAEASSLFLGNDDGSLRLAIARNVAVVSEPIIVPRGGGIAGSVFENGEPLLVRDAYSDARFYAAADAQTGFKTRSILCAPLASGANKIGVLQVLNPRDKTAFDESDLEVFVAYAHLAGGAMQKLRALEQERAQERLAQELSLAHEIQTSFLPSALPQHRDCAFAVAYRPASTVGGDFYDVVEVGGDEMFFVIGDVSGKGVPAALLMAQSLSMLRSILQSGLPPGEALSRWNRMLCGRTIRGMFITAILGRLVPSKREVELACAGHCPPFRIGGEAATDVALSSAPPLGLLETLEYRGTALALAPGEWLAFFTDGLTESFDLQSRMLEREGVRHFLQKPFASATAVVAALRHAEEQHRGSAPPHDDLTVLVLGFR